MQPVFSFSDQLRARAIAYFKREFDVALTNEEADVYLDSLAGLFLAFADQGEEGRAPP